MTPDLLLGLDLGTTRCKALLMDAAGAEVAATMARTPFVATAGRIEAAPEALWGEIGGMLAALGPDRSRIAGIGITGIAECGVPLDDDGRPLAPIISWHDPRGGEIVARLEAAFGDSIGLRTGQRPRQVSTVAKLGWLVDHGCRGVASWLGVPEMCLWVLTATQATEYSLACRTGCYDVVQQAWIPAYAQVAGFSIDAFPAVRAAGEAMGVVTSAAASRWDLPAGVPVTIAGHDHLAGAAGAGATFGDLVNSVGTAETVLGLLRKPPDMALAMANGIAVSVAPGGRSWAALASSARSGVILAAVSRALRRPIPELDLLAAGRRPGPGDPGPGGIRNAAGTAGAGTPRSGEVDVSGLLAAAAEGRRFMLPAGSPAAIWQGLLQALAGRTADAVTRVSRLMPTQRMILIGGGSRSGPWVQAKTTAIGLPIVRVGTRQAAARGAALYAGVSAGWWPSVAEGPRAPLVDT